jgi:hypothetical protein
VIFGEMVIENFGYGFEDSELPLFHNETAQPTGETARVRDFVIATHPGGAVVKVRFRVGEMWDEFSRQVTRAGIVIAQPGQVPGMNGGLTVEEALRKKLGS